MSITTFLGSTLSVGQEVVKCFQGKARRRLCLGDESSGVAKPSTSGECTKLCFPTRISVFENRPNKKDDQRRCCQLRNTLNTYEGTDAFIQSVSRSIYCVRKSTVVCLATALILVSIATYATVTKANESACRNHFEDIAEHITSKFLSELSTKLWTARAVSVTVTAVAASTRFAQPEVVTSMLQRLVPEELPGLIGSKVTVSPLLCIAKNESSIIDAQNLIQKQLCVQELEVGSQNTQTTLSGKVECCIGACLQNASYPTEAVSSRISFEELSRSKTPILLEEFKPSLGHTRVATVEEPRVAIFTPVVDPEGGNVIGSIKVDFQWSRFFSASFPQRSDGTVIVVQNSGGQVLSFRVEGTMLTFRGRGDLHHPRFSQFSRETSFDDFKTIERSLGLENKGQVTPRCLYRIRVYPSDEHPHRTPCHSPLFYTTAVVLFFAFMLAVFGVSDFLIGRHQSELLAYLKRFNELISSLFPETVRSRVLSDRLLRPPTPRMTRKLATKPKKISPTTGELTKSPKQHLRRILSVQQDIADLEIDPESEPIADFFPEATVIFADIAGFTAWSSEREPAQVFKLLETLYGVFDSIAHKLGVFKVETVGDCYVAVAGIPEPQEDHAVIMAWFAYECMIHMHQLTKTLESSLGPSTADLSLRIGLHSGPVTAGVLRGEKSRFQLFGDTVNTASRMESTGRINMIQVTQTTANLLIAAGKSHWIRGRDELISVKGKGEMKTYWVNPTRGLTAKPLSSSFLPLNDFVTCLPDISTVNGSSRIFRRSVSWGLRCDSSFDFHSSKKSCVDFLSSRLASEKSNRLVDWNEELLFGLLNKVVARRACVSGGFKMSSSKALSSWKGVEWTPWEERAEMIEMPRFDSRAVGKSSDQEPVELDRTVRSQLRYYIETIAARYQDNSFHNFEHASHVAMSASKLMKRIITPDDVECKPGCGNTRQSLARAIHDRTLGISSDPLMQFAVAFSALIHDVDHQGVPNGQLIQENSPFARKYNGKSVAEQNSIQVAWDILMEVQFAELRACIFADDVERQRFRQLLVNGVIATDIEDRQLNCERKERWEKAFNQRGQQVDYSVDREATIVFEYIIQASDVAHTMQHWYVYRKWNERLFQERYAAYCAGRGKEDPSVNWYVNEIGFFDNYIIPLAKKLKECGVFGVSGDEYLTYALENRHEWELKGKEILEDLKSKYQVETQLSAIEAPSLEDSWGLFVGIDENDILPVVSPVA